MIPGVVASAGTGLGAILGEVWGTARQETYSAALSVADGTAPYTWSIISGALPAGLALNTSTGAITGVVPNTETLGYYTAVVEVTDVNGKSSRRTIEIGVGDMISLLHLNGTNGGTSFPDETGKSWTRSGVTTQTSVSKFGGSAADFTSGTRHLRLPNASATEFNFGTDDFTLDLWFYCTNWSGSTYNGLIAKLTGGANQGFGVLAPGGALSAGGTGWSTVGGAPAVNTWHHVALTRKAGVIRLFLNGALVASTTYANITNGTTSQVTIGRLEPSASTGQFRGYMNEVRSMRGAARWVAGFTPPASPSDYPI